MAWTTATAGDVCTVRSAAASPCAHPASGADHLHPRLQPRLRGRLGRQCRTSRYRPQPSRRCRRPAMDHQRLSPAAQRAAAAGRRARRPLRTPRRADLRRGAVRRRLGLLRVRPGPALAARRARLAGRGRGASAAQQPGDPRDRVLGRGTRPSRGDMVGREFDLGRPRPGARRLADRRLGLARDLPAQHSTRHRGNRARLGIRARTRTHRAAKRRSIRAARCSSRWRSPH